VLFYSLQKSAGHHGNSASSKATIERPAGKTTGSAVDKQNLIELELYQKPEWFCFP